MAVTARRSIERHLATVPVDERVRTGDCATEPVGRGEPPAVRLATEPVITEPVGRGEPPLARLATEPVITEPVGRSEPPLALLGTEPVLTEPVGRSEPPLARLGTEPLPACFAPRAPLPWPRRDAAPIPMETAPLPLVPDAPPVVAECVVVRAPDRSIRRASLPPEAEEGPRGARSIASRTRELAMTWLLVGSTAAFFGMVAALLMRWWMG
ncbi:uncharacterized protein SOCEGT47_055270 [Sorangium cellulosum]|uniref:Uncharacterized protein n=1 Tax=Sorangium cellulosum TaxID=56 RepID=A0A4P2Q774_SORCE|nr:hypothetical protein [Sorangium cellulosum]AUX24986.1 uncharacterized protein SOCEGT47_055270 [Sorangium cellulosum]